MKAVCLAYEPNAWAVPYCLAAWLRVAPDVGMATCVARTGTTFGRAWLEVNAAMKKPYLLMLEDYLAVDCDLLRMADAFRLACRPQCGFVRLYPCPPGTLPGDAPGFTGICPQAAYSLSLQATVWTPAFVRALIRPEWNAWDCEIAGSAALAAGECRDFSLHCAETSILSYRNLLRRGEAQPEEMEHARLLLHA